MSDDEDEDAITEPADEPAATDVSQPDEQSESAPSEPNRIRLSDILNAAEGDDERELSDEEAEAVRAAGERLRETLAKFVDPPWAKNFTNLSRLTNLTASGKFFQLPEVVRMNALGKSMTHSFPKFLQSSTEPSWMKGLKVVDSDLYRNLGLGQANLTRLGNHLVKNVDFGLDPSAGKFASLWAAQQTSVLSRLSSLAGTLKVGFYPPNLAAIENLRLEDVEEVVMIDGIALYAVPRTAIAEKLINAKTTSERRTILGSRWKSISADCRAAIEGCTSERVTAYAPFVLSALDALDAGNSHAAQALAASIIDTVVSQHFGKDRKDYTPGKGSKQAYDAFTVREFIAFAPLWQAYQQYFVTNGDAIPSTFSRHASVHGVSNRQFSRRNAVQASMFVTGILTFLDEQAARAEAA